MGYEERQAARRSRIDPLTRAKIDRRCAEIERYQRPRELSDLRLGAWYWVELVGRRIPGKLLASVDGIAAAFGLAELGTVQIVQPSAVGRELSPAELSDHLRREPVARDWGEEGLAERILAFPNMGMSVSV